MSVRTLSIVTVAICQLLLFSPSAWAAEASSSSSAQAAPSSPSIWLVSTRHLGCAGSTDVDLSLMRYDDGAESWSDTTLQSFLEEGAHLPTVFYVHGNRRSWNAAFQEGWAFYHSLLADTCTDFRYVIWSWPSDQLRGPIRDVRTKSYRTNEEGYYLGWLLGRMHPENQVSLVGYSFGARIITGAMHVLGGGTLANGMPVESSGVRTPIRAVLLAAAVHSDWLLPGRPHENAWHATGQLAVLYNSVDPVLQRYHLIERRCKPRALGYVGFWGEQQLGNAAHRLTNRDVACYIGRTHDFDAYLCSNTVMSWVREASLGDPAEQLVDGEPLEASERIAASVQK